VAVNINFDFRGSIYERFPISFGIHKRLRSALHFSLRLNVSRHKPIHFGIGHGIRRYL